MSHDESSDERAPSRRSLLQQTAVGSAGVLASSGLATAESGDGSRGITAEARKRAQEAKAQLVDDYASKDFVAVFDRETADLRAEHAKKGNLPSDDVSVLATDFDDVAVGEDDFAITSDGIGMKPVYDYETGTASAYLFAATTVDGSEVHVVVKPEFDDRYVLRTASEDDLETQGHEEDCEDVDKCQLDCNHPTYGAIYFGYHPGYTTCAEYCTREATCDECPDQDKCDDSDWL